MVFGGCDLGFGGCVVFSWAIWVCGVFSGGFWCCLLCGGLFALQNFRVSGVFGVVCLLVLLLWVGLCGVCWFVLGLLLCVVFGVAVSGIRLVFEFVGAFVGLCFWVWCFGVGVRPGC